MKRSTHDTRLRQWLRSGDPLPPGEELAPTDASRMRRLILASARPLGSRRYWQAAAVAAALASVVAGAHLLSRTLASHPADPLAGPTRPQRADIPGDPTRIAAFDTAEPVHRQIQFTTRGGTRVIWLLKATTHPETRPQELP